MARASGKHKLHSEPEIESRTLGYARVSTEDQKLDLQLDALKRAGVMMDNVHVDKISGSGGKKRPGLDFAIMDLRKGDELVVWRLDRLARNMRDLLHRIKQIEDAGATFRSLTESFDTKSAGGRFLIYVLGAVAELEAQLTAERTRAGVKALRDRQDGEWGAPIKMTPEKIKKCEALMLKPGATVPKIAKRLKISEGSIYGYFPGGIRALKKRKAAARKAKRK